MKKKWQQIKDGEILKTGDQIKRTPQGKYYDIPQPREGFYGVVVGIKYDSQAMYQARRGVRP